MYVIPVGARTGERRQVPSGVLLGAEMWLYPH